MPPLLPLPLLLLPSSHDRLSAELAGLNESLLRLSGTQWMWILNLIFEMFYFGNFWLRTEWHLGLWVSLVFPANGVNLSPSRETPAGGVQSHISTSTFAVGQQIFLCNFNLFVHLRLTCGPHQEEGGRGW